jgi:DNA-binding YbaB/EbfC family protein
MKSAREIQGKIEDFKGTLSQTPVEALSGGGMVRIQGRADGTVTSVVFDEKTFQTGDQAMLEDLIQSAFNAFQQKVGEVRKEKLGELTGGLNLPPGMDLGL